LFWCKGLWISFLLILLTSERLDEYKIFDNSLGRILIHMAEEIPGLVSYPLPVQVIGGIFLILEVLTRITADSFLIEMIRRYANNGYLNDLQSTSNQTGCNIISLLLLLAAIFISLLLTRSGRISIGMNILRVFRHVSVLFRITISSHQVVYHIL
jgi:hypothetical protein